MRDGPKTTPKNKLSEKERAQVLAVANSEEFRNLSPKQIVPILADRGEYIASESTFYRVLREEEQLAHRGRAAPRNSRAPEPKRASGPNEVWSWDITYLRSTTLGLFFYAYLVVDIWSRKIVGWTVETSECGNRAAKLLADTIAAEDAERVGLILHSDNGSPMKSATLKATLEHLGVMASFSRPRVSDDNPFSEALIRTAKYWPGYPDGGFADLEQARCYMDAFVDWYNTVHLHSAIGYVTPSDRHSGASEAILRRRSATYEAARARHPERWAGRNTRNWSAPEHVVLNGPTTSYKEATPSTSARQSA